MTYEQAFMFFLPRICEHCLNPSCVASCPSGAMYKREEDGIVLVDQDRCRGWRYCVSGCPYKKVYFNHNTGKAEKCTLCYPRIELGQPTICSETCVGRIRYLGLVLYDADRVQAAASVPDERDLLAAQRDVFLDPGGPGGARGRAARRHPARLDRRRAALADLRPGDALGRRAAAAPGVPHAADGLVRAAAVAGGLDARDRRLRGRPRRRLRRDRHPADPARVHRQPASRGRRRRRPRRPAPARGDALLHAQARGARRDRRAAPGARRADRSRARAHVPAAGDRRLRRPLRDPAGPRRARRAADAGAGRLRPGLRRRAGQLRRRRPAARHAPRRSCPTTARASTCSTSSSATRTRAHETPSRRRTAAARRGRCCRSCCATPTPASSRPRATRSPARWPRCRPDRCATRSSASSTAGTGDPTALAARYVETFDLRRRASLYLTYYAHGDTRERGMALLRLKKLYRAAGLPMDSAELPDHLDGDARVRRARPARPRRGAAGRAPGRRSSCCGSRCTTCGSPYAHVLDADRGAACRRSA